MVFLLTPSIHFDRQSAIILLKPIFMPSSSTWFPCPIQPLSYIVLQLHTLMPYTRNCHQPSAKHDHTNYPAQTNLHAFFFNLVSMSYSASLFHCPSTSYSNALHKELPSTLGKTRPHQLSCSNQSSCLLLQPGFHVLFSLSLPLSFNFIL